MRATIFSCYDFTTGAKPSANFTEYRVARFDLTPKETPKKQRASKINERLRNAKAKKP